MGRAGPEGREVIPRAIRGFPGAGPGAPWRGARVEAGAAPRLGGAAFNMIRGS